MKTESQKIIFPVIFAVYMLIVLKLTVFRSDPYDERQLNLAPFIHLIEIYKTAGAGEFTRLFFGNIGWFVPFGFLLPLLMKKESFFITLAFGMAFSFFIESIQFIFSSKVHS